MQIAIVVYPRFTALDFIGPYEVLRNLPGADVRFVWHEPGPIVADSGVLAVGATHGFAETPDPDIVVVPGGPGFAEAARDKELISWLQAVAPKADWVASVCTGSMILGAAGLLTGRRATSHWVAVKSLALYGAVPVTDERIVVPEPGQRIVTAAGVSAGIDMALWLAAEIAGPAKAEAIALMIEYDPQPPVNAGDRGKASAATVTRAAALVARDGARPGPMTAAVGLLWDAAIARIRR